MMQTISIGDGDILLAVDVQNDFCLGGALAVPGADPIVPVINALGQRFPNVVVVQDWHPPGHLSFASTHGKRPYDTVELSYGRQRLWPDHCVQDTWGAGLHRDLAVPHAALILRKGIHREIDSYSALYENDRKTPTGLAGYLKERGFTRLFLAGLALDFCVRYTAEDASREGFAVVVVEDACRAIDVGGSLDDTHQCLAARAIRCVAADDIG
jgi:nicotinamidase/pyrazinamidase